MRQLREPEGLAPIERVAVSAYTIPTETPESDGTLAWDSTTIVVVEAEGGGEIGLGYTYADTATAQLIDEPLADCVTGKDVMNVRACWDAMAEKIRNLGRPGIASMAIAAVDNALWDLKAKVLGQPLVVLLGSVRDAAPIYGSGGFTSYSIDRLTAQLGTWAEDGMRRVKMKIGRDWKADVRRVNTARKAIGPDTELFVDANGAYSRKLALSLASVFADDFGVTWFEEPVPSDDLEGLHFLRDRTPGGMAVAAGEYGYTLSYFRRMLEAAAVDVMQADVTRCAGVTGFLQVAALCEAFHTPLSAHCAPALHLHLACALPNMCHIEYFFDHARIENELFDGVARPRDGVLAPDLTRNGFGIEFKRADAERFAV